MKAIYLLSDPDLTPRYVGQAWNPGARYDQHIGRHGRLGSEKDVWIESLLNQGQRPVLSILDVVREEDAGLLELLWMGNLLLAGHALVNSRHDQRLVSTLTSENIAAGMQKIREQTLPVSDFKSEGNSMSPFRPASSSATARPLPEAGRKALDTLFTAAHRAIKEHDDR